jgi:8-oxo-dGTP diphosphatase
MTASPSTHLTISAACLLDAEGRLLLVRKRGTSAFMLPGGKHEAGEDALAALCRELQEELGLTLPRDAFTPLGRFQAPAANEADTWISAEVFTGQVQAPVSVAAELDAQRWLVRGEPWPEDLAPLLRLHVLPALWPDAGEPVATREDFHRQHAEQARREAGRLLAERAAWGPRWPAWVATQLYALSPAPYAAMVRRELERLSAD